MERIAVLTIKNHSRLDDQSILYLTKQLRTMVHLIVSPNYLLMTQENIELLVASQEELNRCLESECEIIIGQKLQAHYVITAEIFKIPVSSNPLKLSISLFETKKGSLLSGVNAEAADIDMLAKQFKNLTKTLFIQSKLTALNQEALQMPLDMPSPQNSLKSVQEMTEQRTTTPSPKSTLERRKNQGELEHTPLQSSNQPSGNHHAKNEAHLKQSDQDKPAKKPLFEKPGIDWIKINGGTFEMGHEDYPFSTPKKTLTISSFWISKTEITVAQYQKCIDAGVCTLPISYQSKADCHWENPTKQQSPINCIFWDQARRFANWLSADLPSEAQWEYAARSEGQELLYPWGDDLPSCDFTMMNDKGKVACGLNEAQIPCQRSRGHTMQGLCDMSGNLWEFILDEYQGDYQLLPINANAYCHDDDCLFNAQYRVMRGGSFKTIEPSYLGNYDRMKVSRDHRDENIGFRLVKMK